jgi:uncharacterized membrane protein
MTRDAFIARLRAGLRGLPPAKIADIVADYDTHFAEAAAAGRKEEDVAAALGDPDRLALELRAEAGLQRWEEQRNPSAAAQAVFAVLGLGAIDLIILLPILMWVLGVLLGWLAVAVVGTIGGAGVMVAGPFLNFPGGPAAAIFAGLGLLGGGVAAGASLTLVSIGLVNLLVWYGRLHYRLLKPAIDPQV